MIKKYQTEVETKVKFWTGAIVISILLASFPFMSISNAATSEPILVTSTGMVSYPEPINYFYITIFSGTGGTTNPNTGNYSFQVGESFNVVAIPEQGYNFSKWLLNNTDYSTNPSITIQGQTNINYNLQPIFEIEETPNSEKLFVEGLNITDASGNPIRLQGVNAEPRDVQEEDIQWLKSKGFNYIRVDAFWHRLEPREDVYDNTYFGYLDNILNLCEEYEIYANLVFMQWQWSPYFSYHSGSGTGFPSWVINEGGYENSATGLRDCIADFYMKRNSHGIWMREEFFEFWTYLINRYKDNEYVIAYEVINEPTIAKEVNHVSGVYAAVMDLYEEFTETFRQIDPITIHVYHDTGGEAEEIVPYSNIVWTRSWYNVMYGGYSASEYNQIVSRIDDIKDKYNTNLGTPFLISEMGFTLTDEGNGGAAEWIQDSFDVMRQVGLNDEYEHYGWFIYDKGTLYNFRTPRNNDGTDTWIVPILQDYL